MLGFSIAASYLQYLFTVIYSTVQVLPSALCAPTPRTPSVCPLLTLEHPIPPPLSSNPWAGREQPVHLTLLHAESCVERPTTSCISLPPFWLVPMCIMACLWHPELLQSETFNKRLWNNEFLANNPFLTLFPSGSCTCLPTTLCSNFSSYNQGRLHRSPWWLSNSQVFACQKTSKQAPPCPQAAFFYKQKIAQPRTKPVGYNTKQILYFSPGYY